MKERIYKYHPVLGVVEIVNSGWSLSLVRKKEGKGNCGYDIYIVDNEVLSHISTEPEKAPSNPTQDYTTIDFRTNNEYLWEWE